MKSVSSESENKNAEDCGIKSYKGKKLDWSVRKILLEITF